MKTFNVSTRAELAAAFRNVPLDETCKIILTHKTGRTVYRLDYPYLCDVLDARQPGNGSVYQPGRVCGYGGNMRAEKAHERMRCADPEARAAMYRDRLNKLAAKISRMSCFPK